MCLILVGWRPGPDLSLVAAANRDEYFDRPAAAADFWRDAPQVLAGRDRRHGGTWMGISRSGRFAAVANYREPPRPWASRQSRGLLVSEFLCGTAEAPRYMESVRRERRSYDAFNLLVGDGRSLWLFSSVGDELHELEPGLYGISNGAPDRSWPKVRRGLELFRRALDEPAAARRETLFAVLGDRTLPPDTELPDMGPDPDRDLERRLASVFVSAGAYGTRTSTVLLIDGAGGTRFEERTFDETGTEAARAGFEFSIEDRMTTGGERIG